MSTPDLDIETALDTLTQCLQEHLSGQHIQDPVMIGIHTGGVWIARALQTRLRAQGLDLPLGTLDISFYRDDFTRVGINPQVRPSDIPFEIDDKHIILVDDVLYTGRTIRAALNELFDYGRPASVSLAVLVERDARQLPIAANCYGMLVHLQEQQQIKLSGPEPLSLEVVDTP